MKKIYQNILSILLLGFFSITSFAQGTWKASGTETAINASTEIALGITNISCMHSDATTVVGKADAGAPSITYHAITYDNQAFIQGNTNGMYYAFRPSQNGTLDIAVKMGSAKNTFVLELTDACPDNANLAALTTNIGTANTITGEPTYFALPQVYDTYNQTTGTWNGTAPMQSTGANVYLVMSFPVLANKTYVVGCFGSKLMLRGIHYSASTKTLEIKNGSALKISPNPANGSVIVDSKDATIIGIYSAGGKLIKQQLVTPLNKTIDISSLAAGVYFVKDLNNKNKTQKLIVK